MERNDKPEMGIVKFANTAIPLPVESLNADDSTYVTRGNDNLYPNFLLSLYSKSPIFANVINQKASFINGGGLVVSTSKTPLNGKPNTDDTYELFTDKIIKSFLLFNSYAVEVNFNAFGEPIVWNFISYEKVRLNKSKTKVWVCQDWTKKKNILLFDRYITGKDYGDDKTKSKVFIYDGYIPTSNSAIYPAPEYNSLIRHLLIDVEITEFNYSNIKNHFSVSTLINVYQNADDDSKRDFLDKLNSSYTGAEGNKMLVSWNNQSANSKPTEVTPLSSGDWSEKYEAIKANNNETIFLGMGITNPSLFGFKSAGALGNTQELLNSYEIFSKNVISVKRNELEAGLREMFNADISFKDVPLFDTTLTDEMKKAVLTIDEIRESAGLSKLPNEMGAMLIGTVKVPENISNVTPNVSAGFNNIEEYEHVFATPEHFESVKHLGVSKAEFTLYEGNFAMAKLQFDDESDITKFIIDNAFEGITLHELKKIIREKLGINVSVEALQENLDRVEATGVIGVNKDGEKITIVTGDKLLNPVPKRTIETVYEYVKRPEAAGETKLVTTRPFCEKIIDANKFYSLEDIQTISSVLNYDVFIHTGGFWRLKGTTGKANDANTKPHCRHEWKQRNVVRKPNDKL